MTSQIQGLMIDLSCLSIITVTDVLGLASTSYDTVCFLASFLTSFSDSVVVYSSLPDLPSIPEILIFIFQEGAKLPRPLPVALPDVFSTLKVVVSLFSHSYDENLLLVTELVYSSDTSYARVTSIVLVVVRSSLQRVLLTTDAPSDGV
jgi:hypothetical protein